MWTKTSVFVGTVKEDTIVVDGKLFGENIPIPINCQLEARMVVECRPMNESDVQHCINAEDIE